MKRGIAYCTRHRAITITYKKTYQLLARYIKKLLSKMNEDDKMGETPG